MDDFSENEIKEYIANVAAENSISFLERLKDHPSFDGENVSELLA
jgi:hypothetical protein